MERQKTEEKVKENIEIARQNNVHIDAAFNPFLDEKSRQNVIRNQEQDPEWD